jgi:NADPH-dependent curcumin reductase CurA
VTIQAQMNRRILLQRRPAGMLAAQDHVIVAAPLAPLDEGDARIETAFLAMDPVTRVMLGADIAVMPPIALGAAIRGFGVGEVVETRHPDYPLGARVAGFFEWADYQNLATTPRAQVLPEGVGPIDALTLYGHTAHAAYFGMIEVARVARGDIVVVTGASGAVGSVAAQIARIKGARVIGTAGTAAKRAWLTDRLGLAAALDYRRTDLGAELARLAPGGIDEVFDNVGGRLLDVLAGHMAPGGRIALCGAMAQYLEDDPLAATLDQAALKARGASAARFNAMDYAASFAMASAEMTRWASVGWLHVATRIVPGLEQAPAALNSLFSDGGEGRLLIDVRRSRPQA